MMGWAYQYRIADCIVQFDSNTKACEQGMQKFLCLYEVVQGYVPDLTFSVIDAEGVFSFLFTDAQGKNETLWVSQDADEVTAALEIHLYSKLVQYLDAQNIVSIHSAVLNIENKAVMFAGVSGAGKSSVCTAGLLGHAKYLSDEFTLLDELGYVHPFPRPMQWEHPTHPAFDRDVIEATGLLSSDYFDFPAASGEQARCYLWHPTHIQRQPLQLTTVILHQYRPDIQAVELKEVPRHQALLALPEHLHVQHGLAKDLPRLNKYIGQTCKFYTLHFPSAIDAWKTIKAEVLKENEAV